jgi:hypothetical protein
MQYKLGKLPARNAITLKLADYLDESKFPQIPKSFGHEGLKNTFDWGMLGNDSVGDCVIAGGMHETMLWSRVGGNPIAPFNEDVALQMYSDITGYSPDVPGSDQGTDMAAAAAFRKKTGLLDANGVRHKVDFYLALTPGNLKQYLIALYLFEAVGIGLLFPESAEQQFTAGQPWTVESSNIIGGHYVPLVSRRTYINLVTWGKLFQMTDPFFARYNDEGIVYLSSEMLINKKSAEGVDYNNLIADLGNLNPGKTAS